MNRKYVSPFDQTFSKTQLENICITNKYFKTVLVAYYKLTRNKTIIESIEDLKNIDVLKALSQEYVDFLSGMSIQIAMNDENLAFDHTQMFKIPINVQVRDPIAFLNELKQKMNQLSQQQSII